MARALASFLFTELLKSLGINPSVTNAERFLHKIAAVTSAANIEDYHHQMESFLHPGGAGSAPAEASKFTTADRTTANDNAAGLRGGGSAIEHLKNILEKQGKGFIILFRLNSLDVIHDRYGTEAVEDCPMAVSAYLTASLRSDDAVHHWSDSSLLAIVQSPVSESILSAAIQRIVDNNRDITIQIGGRLVMLRVPLEFELTPIDCLQSAVDLYCLSALAETKG